MLSCAWRCMENIYSPEGDADESNRIKVVHFQILFLPRPLAKKL